MEARTRYGKNDDVLETTVVVSKGAGAPIVIVLLGMLTCEMLAMIAVSP
jgi:hypothetical protein